MRACGPCTARVVSLFPAEAQCNTKQETVTFTQSFGHDAGEHAHASPGTIIQCVGDAIDPTASYVLATDGPDPLSRVVTGRILANLIEKGYVTWDGEAFALTSSALDQLFNLAEIRDETDLRS